MTRNSILTSHNFAMSVRSRSRSAATCLGIFFLLNACDDSSRPVAPINQVPNDQLRVSQANSIGFVDRPIENEQLRIGREVPGFGGYFFDRNGQLVILAVDLGSADLAKSRVLDAIRREGRPQRLQAASHGKTVTRISQYTFLQLVEWRDRLVGPALDLSGVTFVDLDEARNVITVGFNSESGRIEAQRLFSTMGIPEAVIVFESSHPEPTADLRSRVRPLTAGTVMGPIGCTLGASAIREGTPVILTASHCTAVWNEDDFGPTRQNLSSPSFGIEVFDENGWICGFFYDVRCRFADVAAYDIAGVDVSEGETGFQLGRIARPIYAVSGVSETYGPLQIDDSNPFFQIIGTYDYPLMNETMSKVGITTGWTYGNIYKTCVDVNYSGSPKKRYVCQDWAVLFTQDGDSGGPVFIDTGSGSAIFMGIVTGRDGRNGAMFGNVSQLRKDLGPFQVY